MSSRNRTMVLDLRKFLLAIDFLGIIMKMVGFVIIIPNIYEKQERKEENL